MPIVSVDGFEFRSKRDCAIADVHWIGGAAYPPAGMEKTMFAVTLLLK